MAGVRIQLRSAFHRPAPRKFCHWNEHLPRRVRLNHANGAHRHSPKFRQNSPIASSRKEVLRMLIKTGCMSIRCRQCGANNHSANGFCLTCGVDLTQPREPLIARPTPPKAPEPPSLSESSSSDSVAESNELAQSVRSLFQAERSETQEPRKSRASRFFLLALLALAAATAAWHWRGISTFASKFSEKTAVNQTTATNSSSSPGAPLPSAEPEPQSVQAADSTTKRDGTATEASVDDYPSQPASVAESPKARIQPASQTTHAASTWETEGEKYLYGDGVPVNCERAQKELLAAAKHSSAKAQSELGSMYATGHCVIRDLPLAYRWFARAQRQEPRGNRKIAEDMRELWAQMSPEEKQLATR